MGGEPVSVLLPTTTWTTACQEVADQFDPADELLVVCDTEHDPVAEQTAVPDSVDIVVADEPEHCSGKANAIDAGMERARNDRIVWTDDDFHHPPDWLATMQSAYDAHGPVSEVPFFTGRDPLSILLEPSYAFSGTLLVWAGDVIWGGAVIFDRSDLDVESFRSELRRTVSDDGILGEHLDVTTVRRARRVEIGGSFRETLERHVRFIKLVRFHAPLLTVGNVLGATGILVACLLFPLLSAGVLTLGSGMIYAAFGHRRWTVVLAYPAMALALPLLLYSLARRTFVWGGRRYRWRHKFDVEVVD